MAALADRFARTACCENSYEQINANADRDEWCAHLAIARDRQIIWGRAIASSGNEGSQDHHGRAMGLFSWCGG